MADNPVIVAGAGVGGLSAALALAAAVVVPAHAAGTATAPPSETPAATWATPGPGARASSTLARRVAGSSCRRRKVSWASAPSLIASGRAGSMGSWSMTSR